MWRLRTRSMCEFAPAVRPGSEVPVRICALPSGRTTDQDMVRVEAPLSPTQSKHCRHEVPMSLQAIASRSSRSSPGRDKRDFPQSATKASEPLRFLVHRITVKRPFALTPDRFRAECRREDAGFAAGTSVVLLRLR